MPYCLVALTVSIPYWAVFTATFLLYCVVLLTTFMQLSLAATTWSTRGWTRAAYKSLESFTTWEHIQTHQWTITYAEMQMLKYLTIVLLWRHWLYMVVLLQNYLFSWFCNKGTNCLNPVQLTASKVVQRTNCKHIPKLHMWINMLLQQKEMWYFWSLGHNETWSSSSL